MSDNKFRPIQAAQEATESVKSKAKGKLLDWLPRHECDNCGAICEADTQYIERQASIEPVWQCPDESCGKRYYRSEDNPLSFEMWDK